MVQFVEVPHCIHHMNALGDSPAFRRSAKELSNSSFKCF